MDALSLELELSRERYVRNMERIAEAEGAGSDDYALGLIDQVIGKFCDDVQELLCERTSDRGQLKAKLRELDPDVLALAILQPALCSIARYHTLRGTHLAIGEALHRECWSAGLATKKRLGIERKLRKIAPTFNRRLGLLKRRGEDYGLTDWTQTMLAHAGNFGVNALLQFLPDVFLVVPMGREQGLIINEDHEAHKKACALVTEMIVRRPVWLPVLEPPPPWTDLRTGGTSDRRLAPSLCFVRTSRKETLAEVKAAMRNGSMRQVMAAVNAMQAVPFKINTRLLGVMRACMAANIEVEGMPKRPDLLFNMDIQTAEALSEHEQFYCAMNLDWRGRAYGVPMFNFQRDDRVRSLFLFARGEPIGDEGLYWLKVHVANCGDFNKVSKRSFEERIKWVNDNLDGIESVTIAPTKELWWTQADKPFLFLAACMELVAALRQGTAYVTRLPVSFDGSCSGLQHLAAMTRDEQTARLVNLIPGPSPNDVYQVVADRVKDRITRDLQIEEKRQIAQICLDYGIGRKLVKRNVMTYSYSAKAGGPGMDGRLHGMAGQHWEDLMKPLRDEVREGKREEHPFGPDNGRAASLYLAKTIYTEIENTVFRPANAMAFLQKLAKALAHESKSLRWSTPCGLPWINSYHESNVKQVRLWLYDRGVKVRLTMNIGEGFTRTVDKTRAANGVAPNFVHALDATHMFKVINASVQSGIVDHATVHDSFGCLAPHATRFRQIIQDQFARLYEEHDVLRDIQQSALNDLTSDERVPPLPARGTLDVAQIRNAEFSFA